MMTTANVDHVRMPKLPPYTVYPTRMLFLTILCPRCYAQPSTLQFVLARQALACEGRAH